MKYHLAKATAPRKHAIYSFFENVVHFDDNMTMKNEYFRFRNENEQKASSVERTSGRMYISLCHGRASRSPDDDQKQQTEPVVSGDEEQNVWKFITESKLTSFGFGVNQNYIHLRPQFASIREELQCNKTCPMNHEMYIGILRKAIRVHMATLRKKSVFLPARAHLVHCGILRNELITMKHIASILLYTDCTQFCILLVLCPFLCCSLLF